MARLSVVRQLKVIHRGPDQQVRLFVASADGRQFFRAEVWKKADGRWSKVPGGLSLRFAEVMNVAHVLADLEQEGSEARPEKRAKAAELQRRLEEIDRRAGRLPWRESIETAPAIQSRPGRTS